MKAQGAVIVDPADIADRRAARRLRVRGPALRVQGGPQRVPRRPRRVRAGPLARGSDRVQRAREGARDAVLRPGDAAAGGEEGTADVAGLSEGAGDLPDSGRGRDGIDAVMTPVPARRDRRADRQPGVDDRSGQRRSLRRAPARRRRRSPAIRASPCRRDSSTGCRSACRSSAGRGARRG